MYSAPLSLLQLPPASLPEVTRKLALPGNTMARFSQDGKTLNDLRGNVTEADFQQAAEAESEAGFVCKKCQMVYPAEILCLNHQRTSCYAKNPNETKSVLKLVQIHVECKVCKERFGTVLDFKFHCDMDRHVKRVQKLKRIEDNAQMKKATANGQLNQQQLQLQNQLQQQQQLRQLHQLQQQQLHQMAAAQQLQQQQQQQQHHHQQQQHHHQQQQHQQQQQQRKGVASVNVATPSAADMLTELANAETASHVMSPRLHLNNAMARGLRLPNATTPPRLPINHATNNGNSLRMFTDSLQRQRDFRNDLEATLSRLNAAAALDGVLAAASKGMTSSGDGPAQTETVAERLNASAMCFNNDKML